MTLTHSQIMSNGCFPSLILEQAVLSLSWTSNRSEGDQSHPSCFFCPTSIRRSEQGDLREGAASEGQLEHHIPEYFRSVTRRQIRGYTFSRRRIEPQRYAMDHLFLYSYLFKRSQTFLGRPQFVRKKRTLCRIEVSVSELLMTISTAADPANKLMSYFNYFSIE